MSKLYAILIAIIVIPTVSGLQTEEIDSFNTQEEFRSFNPTEKGDFNILISHRDMLQIYNKSSKLQDLTAAGSFPWTSSTRLMNNSRYWLTGTRFPGKAILIKNGNIAWKKDIPTALDSEAITDRGKIFTNVGTGPTQLFNLSGEKKLQYRFDHGREELITSEDIDEDSKLEYFSALKKGGFFSIDRDGLEWQLERPSNTGGLEFGEKLMIYWNSGVSKHYPVNGSQIWRANEEVDSQVIELKDRLVYSSDGDLVFRGGDGELLDRRSTDFSSPYIFKMPERNWVGLQEDDRIVFYGEDGEKIGSINMDDIRKRPRIAQYDDDPEMELAVASGNQVEILELEREFDPGNYSVDSTAFVGDSNEMLKAVSRNATVFVGDDFSEFNGSIETEKENFLGLGGVEGVRSANSLDQVVDGSRGGKYYADSREKMVYVAALASRRNASLTFDPESADRDFSGYSLREIRGLFIEEFDPHHIAVADLESEKGLLASYMAAKQGVMPIDLPEEKDNGVILERRINSTFFQIGENRNTVFEGKYISILEGPSQSMEDPVDGRFLDDPADGESFRTDVNYGDLDGDELLEAGVGRYPEDVEMSSTVFHRSMKREIGTEALVASEYMDSNWPVILATGGGGLRYGSRVESVLREEGYDTTHLVEQRSEPVNFLISLTPVELESFLGEVEDTEEMLKNYVTESTANMAGNALVFIEALSYVQQIMEMYYEFRWSTYEIDIDRGLERLDELDVDLDSESDETFQKSVMKVLYAFVWPDRHPEINQSSLTSEMETADIIYYQGVGNSNRWVMPNEDNSTFKDRYTGENRFEPEDIPVINRSIVWDNSNLAGTKDTEMREKFFEQGASSFIGYSTVNYGSHSSISGYNFFLRRKTLGNSMKAGLNRLKMTDFVYTPTLKSGVNQKMTNSLRMYGNPEMPKDPIQQDSFEKVKSCSENRCTLNISIDTPQRVREFRGEKTLIANSSSYIMEPGAPITPLYSFSHRLPDSAEVTDIQERLGSRKAENLSLRDYRPLAYGAEIENSSRNMSGFPDQLSNFSVNSGDIRYAVSGARKTSGRYQVVDNARLTIRYENPVTLEFSSSNRTLEASINSEKDFSGELVYRIDNETGSRNVDIAQGENNIDLENLSYGRHEVEGYLLEDSIVAQKVENVEVRKPLKTVVFSPEIRKGSSRKVTAVVSNPNRFPVTETLKLETRDNLAIGMLEHGSKTFSIGANSDTEVEWRILGTETGEATVSVNGSDQEVEVLSSGDSRSVVATGRFLRRFSSPTSEVMSSYEDGGYKLVWRTGSGRLEVEKNSSYINQMLSTPEFRVERTVLPDRKVEKVSGPGDDFKRVTENGFVRSSGEMEESYLEGKLEILEEEISKMKGFSRRG